MTKRISIILAITLIFTMCFGCISADAATKSKMPKTSITKISVSGSNGVYLKWSKANKAVKYKVYRSTKATSGYKLVKTTKKLSWTDKGLKHSTKYYYKVKAVNKNGKGLTSKYRSIKTKTKPVKKPTAPKEDANGEEQQNTKADPATVTLSGEAIQIGETEETLLADFGEPVDKLTSCRGWIDYIY